MSIKVLLADDSEMMRTAIVRVLNEESGITVIGEAASFAETLQLTATLQPDVLLLDLHMRDEREHPPELVKSIISQHVACILAISVRNDEEAKALADSLGARVLLDKTKLFSELIPAIKQFCSNESIPKPAKGLRKGFKQPSDPSFEARTDGASSH